MNVEAQLNEAERTLARLWKVTALRGVLAIAFAAVIVIWPSIGLTALIALFGVFALASGVTSTLSAGRRQPCSPPFARPPSRSTGSLDS